MNVSVCVIFRNAEKTLPDLIRSFQFLPPSDDQFEFIFIDNNSTDSSRDIIKSSGLHDFKLIKRNVNSLAEARNQAIQQSQYENIYFIDSDCSLNPDTWSELIKNWDPLQFQGCGGFQVFPSSIPFLKILDRMRNHYLGHFGSAQMKPGVIPEQVDHLSTSHVLYKKELLQNLNGFDSRLDLSAEDLELSLRITKSGSKLIFIPTSKVNHLICNDTWGWLKKAWRNGLWQTRLLAINPQIIYTRRFWPSLILLILLPLILEMIVPLSLLYFALLISIVMKEKDLRLTERVHLFGLFISTHLIYFSSGIIGFALGVQDWIRARQEPKKTAA